MFVLRLAVLFLWIIVISALAYDEIEKIIPLCELAQERELCLSFNISYVLIYSFVALVAKSFLNTPKPSLSCGGCFTWNKTSSS